MAPCRGFLAGRGIAAAFRRALVPEYTTVPVLFTTLLAIFALSNLVLQESGLLAVMGIVIANADLPSYEDLRHVKEKATILLVSGAFILLAAGLDMGLMAALDWRAVVFVGLVILVAGPLTVVCALGLTASDAPGVLIVGGSRLTTALGAALQKADVPVMITDLNRGHLRQARAAGLPTFFGDILSEAADNIVEFIGYQTILAATDNDAYNTLVATDLAPEFGRENVFQLPRVKGETARYALPSTLGGKSFGDGRVFDDYEKMLRDGWTIRVTRLSDEFGFDDWREARPEAVLLARVAPTGGCAFWGPSRLARCQPIPA